MQKVNTALETQDPERVAKLNAIKEQVQQGFRLNLLLSSLN